MRKYNTIKELYGIKECIEWLCKSARNENRMAILSGLDLSGLDLSGSNLIGSNLSGLDLSGLDLSGSNLSGSDLRFSNLSGSNLSGSNLSYSDLRFSNLRFSDLRFSDLRFSDLSGSDLSGSDLSGSDFDFSVINLSCKGIGLNFDERVIKQLANHFLKQNIHCEVYEEIKHAFLHNPKWLNWLEDWHRKDEVKHLKEFVKELR